MAGPLGGITTLCIMRVQCLCRAVLVIDRCGGFLKSYRRSFFVRTVVPSWAARMGPTRSFGCSDSLSLKIYFSGQRW